jgi:hypothetical protein
MPPDDGNSAPAAHPRYAAAWAALVCAAATMMLAWPALGGGFLVNPRSDQFIAGYAFREFAAESLRSGNGFPLWNPYLFGGMPYVAAMHGDIFYPTFLLRMILPTDVAMTWGFIIHLFLAGIFTWMFLRRVGLGFIPSLAGALAYMLSGQIASLVSPGHDGKLFVNALFPLTLFFLHAGIRGNRRWAWGALAITVGLAVLSPHPQLLQYMLLASGAYALKLAFFGPREDRLPRGIATRRLAMALGAVILGGAIGAIQYVPVREYVGWSPRAGGMMGGYEHATSYSMPPAEFINTIIPQFTGILDRYWGVNGIHLHSEYLGVVVLILFGAAFGAAGVRRQRFVWFWTGMAVVSALWALGGNTGFYRLVYALVPGTKFFRAPSTIFYVTCFSIAVLAAIGTERFLARDVSRRYLIGWAVAIGFIVLLGVTGSLTGLAQNLAPPGAYDFVADNDSALRLGALRVLLFAALGLGALLLIEMRKLSPTRGGALLLAVLALDLWSIDRIYWQFSQPASVVYGSDPVVEYLKARTDSGRVLPLPTREAARDPFLSGDALMSHDIRSAVGYHGNQLGRYDALIQQLGNPNVWQVANLKYLLTSTAEPPVSSARLVAGPARNAYGTMVYLYEVPEGGPPAWVAPAIVKAADDQVLPTVMDPRFDVSRVALFDTASTVQSQELTAMPEPVPVTAQVTRYDPGAIDVSLDGNVPQGSALLVSENFYPGWEATVDGRPAEVARADYVIMGVPLPAGARQVQLRFQSKPYETGKTITLLALGASMLLVVWGIFVTRREATVVSA